MADQQVHERIMNILMEQIFSNKLSPGTKLPTERQFAKDMNVDRTSLRVALKQLESMNVLDIRQGDGIYVKDYLKNAGIDFLRLLFSQPESKESKADMDEYLMDELWEFWGAVEPEILKLAIKRASPKAFKALMVLLDEELKFIDDKKKIIELETAEQDLVAEVANNTIFLLLANSSRPLRKKMVEIFIDCLDRKALKNHIETKKVMVREFMNGSVEDAVAAAERYRKALVTYRNIVRKSMPSK